MHVFAAGHLVCGRDGTHFICHLSVNNKNNNNIYICSVIISGANQLPPLDLSVVIVICVNMAVFVAGQLVCGGDG